MFMPGYGRANDYCRGRKPTSLAVMYSMSDRYEPSSISELEPNPSDLAGVEVACTGYANAPNNCQRPAPRPVEFRYGLWAIGRKPHRVGVLPRKPCEGYWRARREEPGAREADICVNTLGARFGGLCDVTTAAKCPNDTRKGRT